MVKTKTKSGILAYLAAVFGIALASCSSSLIPFVPYNNYVEDLDAHERFDGDGYYRLGDYSPLTYLNHDGAEESFDGFADVFRHKGVHKSIRATGRQKLLVIPVDFADYPSSDLPEGSAGSLSVLQNAFFGADENAQWRSVAGFYNQSSYGKLVLDGKVTDWYRSSYLASDIRDSSSKSTIVRSIYNSALAWYDDQYGDLAAYYADGNAANRTPVYLVYSHPSETGEGGRDKMFWAYTINQSDALTCWSSYSLTYLDSGKPETHTYIHEVGHLLGLDDYYNTDGETYGPTGRADMMDYSIGDHTGYSKMLLDWTRPYAVTDSCAITIRPFAVNGDLILIKNGWNQTAMDEYLLLEFYAPTGLNAQDSAFSWSGARLMREAGIKVYHVDSRVAFLSTDIFSRPIGYIADGGYSKATNRVAIAHTNSRTTTYGDNRLYHLLEKSGDNTFLAGGVATSETLFKKGDTFGIEAFADFTFDSGEALGYTFAVTQLTNTYATIDISKI